MTFFTENYYADHYDTKLLRAAKVIQARRYILFVRYGAQEEALNRYLVANYHKTLKHICLDLVMKAKIMKNFNHELVVIFPTEEDKQLARLITFGTGRIGGSQILKNALK